MMGSPHPKARRAASQEAWSAGPQSFETGNAGPASRRNIHKIWRRNGLFPATLGLRWHDVLRSCGAADGFDFFQSSNYS
jgi:hypothetical protein